MNGTIPFSELAEYARFYAIPDPDKFFRMMQQIDAACMTAKGRNDGR